MTTVLEEWEHPGEAVTPGTFYGRDHAERLSAAEESALFERMRAGDRVARERLIFSQLGLAVKIAREHEGFIAAERRRGNPVFDFEDVLQEAVAGLVRAVDRHDHTLGQRLSAFTEIHMRGAIPAAFERSLRAIRYGRSLNDRAISVARCRRELTERLGGPPTDEEIEAELGVVVQEGRCRGCGAELVQGYRRPPRRWCEEKACQRKRQRRWGLSVREILSLPAVVDSLNRTIPHGDGSPIELGDLMPETPADGDDEDPQVVEDLYDAVAKLPAKWRWLVIEHFGIDDNEPATVGQIAKRRGVSVSAVTEEITQALGYLHTLLVGREGFPDAPFARTTKANLGPQDLERKTGLSGDALLAAVRRLPTSLRRTVSAHYGLNGRPPMTARQIAAREGVHQRTANTRSWKAVQRLKAVASEDRQSA